MKKLLLIFMLLFSVSVYAGEEFVSITKTSKMKKYNKKAVWRKVKCTHCHGTGSRTVQKYDAKLNRMIKSQKPCQYCHGRGFRGMSKY